jgi:hypothetical protein
MFGAKVSPFVDLFPGQGAFCNMIPPCIGSGLNFKNAPFPRTGMVFLGMGGKGFFEFRNLVYFGKTSFSC